jgi:ribulose-5-phosphate 4-epimerase/fuculose-1-phosphate aldolase
MAHALGEPAAPALLRNSALDAEAVRQARIDLAACFRMAARLGMHEGICNHFSLVVPTGPGGRDDLFLVNPYGWAFSEVTASRLLVCDFEGNVVAGEGVPEATAFFIHARVHKNVPRARACFHTHMPNATSLAMLEGPPLLWAGQSALKFYGRTVVDEDYNGLALDTAEGDRIAASIGEADIVFMKNHGVMVVGNNAAEAWDDLYYLERAAEAQRLALSTGRPLKAVRPDIAAKTYAQMQEGDRESARLHLDSVKRILAKDEPDFAD